MSERSLFLAALEITDPNERSAYLDRACAGDAALRQRLEGLLRAHQAVGTFLETPAEAREATGDFPPSVEPSAAPAASTLPPERTPEGLGMRIGPYRLLQQLGEGGMGTV